MLQYLLSSQLSTLPIGRSSQKVRLLLCSMLPQLDESSQVLKLSIGYLVLLFWLMSDSCTHCQLFILLDNVGECYP
jgi:hypothetical protein